MADQEINIVLRTIQEGEGFQVVNQHVNQVDSSMMSLNKTFQLGIGIDLSRRMIDGFARLPAYIQRNIQDGLAFNEMLQSTADSIRAILIAAGDQNDFQQATGASSQILSRLRARANETGAALTDVISLFQATAASASAAGIPLSEYSDLLIESAVAGANMGRTVQQLNGDLNAIFSGQVTSRNVLANALGLDSETIRSAQEAGELTSVMRQRLARWQTEVDGSAAASNRLRNAIDEALGDVTAQIFAAMEGGMNSFREAIESIDPASLERLGQILGDLISKGLNFAEASLKMASQLKFLAEISMLVGAGLAGLGLVKTIGLAKQFSAAILANVAAMGAETKAVAANTAAHAANAKARAGAAPPGSLGRGAMAMAGGPVGLAVGGAAVGIMAIQQMESSAIARQNAEQRTRDTLAEQTRELQRGLAAMETQEDKAAMRNRLLERQNDLERRLSEARRSGDRGLTEELSWQLRLTDHMIRRQDDIFDRVSDENRAQREKTEQLERQRELIEEQVRQWKEAASGSDQAFADRDNASRSLELSRMSPEDRRAAEVQDLRNQLAEARNRQSQSAPQDVSLLADLSPEELELRQTARAAEAARIATEIAKLTEQIEKAEREITKEKTAQTRAQEQFMSQLAALEAEAAGDSARAQAIQQELDLQQAILQIQRDLNVSESEAAEWAERQMRAQQGINEQVNERQRQTQQVAMEELAMSVQIAELRAAGHEESARALEREVQLQREVRRLVQQTGEDEAKITDLVHRRMEAQEQASQNRASDQRDNHSLRSLLDREADAVSRRSPFSIRTPSRISTSRLGDGDADDRHAAHRARGPHGNRSDLSKVAQGVESELKEVETAVMTAFDKFETRLGEMSRKLRDTYN